METLQASFLVYPEKIVMGYQVSSSWMISFGFNKADLLGAENGWK